MLDLFVNGRFMTGLEDLKVEPDKEYKKVITVKSIEKEVMNLTDKMIAIGKRQGYKVKKDIQVDKVVVTVEFTKKQAPLIEQLMAIEVKVLMQGREINIDTVFEIGGIDVSISSTSVNDKELYEGIDITQMTIIAFDNDIDEIDVMDLSEAFVGNVDHMTGVINRDMNALESGQKIVIGMVVSSDINGTFVYERITLIKR